MNIRSIFRCLLLSGFLFAHSALAQTGTHCGPDLLKLYGLAIPHATLFTSEEPAQPSQKLCESTYKIPGKYARATEAMLIRKYGMGKLVFECCGWSPARGKTGSFRRTHRMADGAYAAYEIYMASGETMGQNRKFLYHPEHLRHLAEISPAGNLHTTTNYCFSINNHREYKHRCFDHLDRR